MMTYDLNGAWGGFTAHQAALYTNPAYDEGDASLSVDSCIKYLENKYGDDIDYSKIVVGVAPYTRGWKEVKKDTGRDPKNTGLICRRNRRKRSNVCIRRHRFINKQV